MVYRVNYYTPKVRELVLRWPSGVLSDYARCIELLADSGPGLRMPQSRAMGDGLFELRVHGPEGAGRALHCFRPGREVVILHAFLKTTEQTPERDICTARKRIAEVRRG